MKRIIQHFFWSCAGADTEILDHCVSDQKKYLSIGAIIFLVACFASLAMFFAAESITDNFWSALGIGLLWGFMILMLDRLIVATIKNDEYTTNRKRIFMALPRIILAIIIASVISRPIEVKLFSKKIEKQILHNRAIEGLAYMKTIKNQQQIDLFLNQDSLIREEIATLEVEALKTEVPTRQYRALQEELVLAKNRQREVKARQKQKEYLDAKKEAASIKNPSNNNLYKELIQTRRYYPDSSFSKIDTLVFTTAANKRLYATSKIIKEVDGKVRVEINFR